MYRYKPTPRGYTYTIKPTRHHYANGVRFHEFRVAYYGKIAPTAPPAQAPAPTPRQKWERQKSQLTFCRTAHFPPPGHGFCIEEAYGIINLPCKDLLELIEREDREIELELNP